MSDDHPPAPTRVIDALGLRCPAPIIALGRAASQDPGGVVELLADDPATAADLSAWARLTGGTVLAVRDHESGGLAAIVRLPEDRGPDREG